MTLTGVRLALDWGRRRIGVAACGKSALLAHPVATICNNDSTSQRLLELLAEYQPTIVYLGLPIALDGSEAQAAIEMRDVARELRTLIPDGIQLRLVDERMSSAEAHRQLTGARVSSKDRRSVIDQVAAVAILSAVLAQEKATQRLAGQLVEVENAPGV